MFGIMIIFCFVYIALVYFIARKITGMIIDQEDKQIIKHKESYQKLVSLREETVKELKDLEELTSEIFTLYDMTKEITKNFDVQEAFETFKYNLSQKVVFEECLLLDALSDEVNSLQKSGNYFIFTLKGKKRLLGSLAIKGMPEEYKEVFMILAHQFALALRRIRLYLEVERLATTDSLTGLQTRRNILEHFQEEMKRSKSRAIKLSFMMIDVDHFKSFNDKYGHLSGDQVLRGISNIVKDNIREIDTAGRYGGEELCVVLPDTDRQGAKYVAERIRSAVEVATIKAYDATVKATVSIGLATFPVDGTMMNELLDKADWALYRAKKKGRNVVCAFGVY